MPGIPGQNLIVGEQPSQLPNPNDNSTTLVLNQDPNFSIDLSPTDVFNFTNTYTLDANEGINWPQGETLYARITPGQTTGTPPVPVNGVSVWVQPGGVVAPPHAISVSGGVNAQALQGWPISPASPTNGQGLLFNGTEWIPTTISGVSPGGPATGDLEGTYPAPNVRGISGYLLDRTTNPLGNGTLIAFDGSYWQYTVVPTGSDNGSVLQFRADKGWRWVPHHIVTSLTAGAGISVNTSTDDITITNTNPSQTWQTNTYLMPAFGIPVWPSIQGAGFTFPSSGTWMVMGRAQLASTAGSGNIDVWIGNTFASTSGTVKCAGTAFAINAFWFGEINLQTRWDTASDGPNCYMNASSASGTTAWLQTSSNVSGQPNASYLFAVRIN